MCLKIFSSNQNLKYHITICKLKIKEENKKEIIEIATTIIQNELKSKDEQIEKLIKQMEEQKKKLEEKVTSNTINNNTTNNNTINGNVNNHLTIYTCMTPEHVKETFDKHYTIETLMGGQKALADFVIDKFVVGKEGMIYLCVDRSRKKFMITEDMVNMKEDVNCETLINRLTPAYPIIKDKVEWSEYETKYVPSVDKIHDSYDEILAVRKDGTVFRSQLSRRLPSTIPDKERMDLVQDHNHTLDDLRDQEEKQFVERKEDAERYFTNTQTPESMQYEPLPEPNMIHGHRLGKFTEFRTMYKEQGIYKIPRVLQEAIAYDPDVVQQFEDYVKRGMFQGKPIPE